MSLSRRTQRACHLGPDPEPRPSWPPGDAINAPPCESSLLREYDSASSLEELLAAVQTAFEEALSAAVGGTPSTAALHACELMLDRLRHALEDAFASDRCDIAVFTLGEYRLRFTKMLQQLCTLELSTDDQLAIVSVLHVSSTYATAVASQWPGTVLPLPLHDLAVVTPLIDRLSPFCEGHLSLRAPGHTSCWQKYWAVLDAGQLALYSSQLEADDDPGTCCLRISLSAVACLHEDDTNRTLTVSLRRVAENARAAGCDGLTVTEELFSSMHLRADMAPDYKAWSSALIAAQEAAMLWEQFGKAQPQWAQLAKARSPRWTTILGSTDKTDIGARMALAASERICMYAPSEEWWTQFDSTGAEKESWSVVLDQASQGMLCVLSAALWTRLAAPAPWYWDCDLGKYESSAHDQCNGVISTELLALAHCELLRQLAAAISAVTSTDVYQQDPEEQARLGAWSMELQCRAGRWCEGLPETLLPLQRPTCRPILQGFGALIHQKQLPSPSLPIDSVLDAASSWCGVDQWCIVNYAERPLMPQPGSGTKKDGARVMALQCTSCVPQKLECCVGGDRSALIAEFGLPDGRCAIVFQGSSTEVPAVLRLDNAEAAEKWKCAIREMQTSAVFLPDGATGCEDSIDDLMEATRMVEELCADLFDMYAAAMPSLHELEEETDKQDQSGGSEEPKPDPDSGSDQSSQLSPPPIAEGCDNAVLRQEWTAERADEMQRAIESMFEDICRSRLPRLGSSTTSDVVQEDAVVVQLQEKAAQTLVRWAEWYSLRMQYVASSLAVAMSLDWGAKLRAAGPHLQATPAFSAAVDVSRSATTRRLQNVVDTVLSCPRTASESNIFTIDGKRALILWQDLVIAARREFEAASVMGCVRVKFNLARGIVKLLVETAAACAATVPTYFSCDGPLQDGLPAGCIEWVCATVNSATLAWPLVLRLLTRFEHAIPDPYRTQLDAHRVKTAVINMARDGIEWLASTVVKDVKTVLGTSSCRQSARDEEDGMEMAMAVVVATIADYFDDFAALLVRQHLETVAEGVATGFVAVYIEALLRDEGLDRIGEDERNAMTVQSAKEVEDDLLLIISVLSPHLSTLRLNTVLQPLRSVAALLVAPIVPPEQFALEFDRLCRKHWGSNGISFALAERVLILRGVADGVISRAQSNARTACEQRLAQHWSAVQLVVAPLQQPHRRTQETNRRRRINRQARGCDTFCHTCAGPASTYSATHQLEQCRTPSAFELLEGELGIPEVSTFAELELFREETALASMLQALEEAQFEICALEQDKQECVAAREMYRAELGDLTAEVAALTSTRTEEQPVQALERLGQVTGQQCTETHEIIGDDI